MTVGMTYLMPVLPAVVPTLVAAMGWVSTTASTLTFAYSIATDLQFIIKNFNRVFCSKDPPQSLIKNYGMTISKIALDISAMILSKKALDAILQTRFFQRIGFRLSKSNLNP